VCGTDSLERNDGDTKCAAPRIELNKIAANSDRIVRKVSSDSIGHYINAKKGCTKKLGADN